MWITNSPSPPARELSRSLALLVVPREGRRAVRRVPVTLVLICPVRPSMSEESTVVTYPFLDLPPLTAADLAYIADEIAQARNVVSTMSLSDLDESDDESDATPQEAAA